MTEEPFAVEPELLREVARALGEDAYRLAHGLAGVSGLVPPADGWLAGVALAELESAVHRWCGGLAARVAATADAVRTAAEGYEAVDDRAARRLAGLPR
ncbi:Excreted virulence factor EspC, type VII ESX diderm [Micromonospora rhizosphaerae]|uniref:Excreted virulence factor EspC, type VII ESX diderm n=1 Tax=Micromonospora rhizosphaerae TaxID=568872 RepID=A0A1C6R812_9ACTN|nr:type VII secretion target [Micromonospora rhizosphaerae]SCL13202.1 Excreted virulence factor EspC, type VII ESX diderm [Micromonospora rhizosphaerae]